MKEIKKIFISGHRDITEHEFSTIYKKKIIDSICKYDCYFYICDYYGADLMAQNFLIDDVKYDINKITVCHMLESPRYYNDKIISFIGGFKTDEERDEYVTSITDFDIAYIRKGKELSGTAQNILRRYTMDKVNNEHNYDTL